MQHPAVMEMFYACAIQFGSQGHVASMSEGLNLFHCNYFYFKLQQLLVAFGFLIKHYSFRHMVFYAPLTSWG